MSIILRPIGSRVATCQLIIIVDCGMWPKNMWSVQGHGVQRFK